MKLKEQNKKNERRWTDTVSNLTVWIFMLTSFAYSVLRAYRLPISYDEAVTFEHFIWRKKSFFEILTYSVPTANNHVLNTLLMKLSVSWFGVSEFTLRIPALAGHALYMAGMYLLMRLLFKRYLLVLSSALCLFHPYLLNFFSMARGYALALGFSAWGLYFALRRLKNFGTGRSGNFFYAFSSCAAFALAVLANITFLNIFVSAVLLLLAFEIGASFRESRKDKASGPSRKQSLSKVFLATIPWILFLALAFTGPIIKLLGVHQLIAEGQHGFWPDTVMSLIQVTVCSPLLERRDPIMDKILAGIGAFYLAAVLVALLRLIRKEKYEFSHGALLAMVGLLFLCASAIVSEHYGFGILYPRTRMVLYLIPPFLLLIPLVWKNLLPLFPRLKLPLNLCFFFFMLAAVFLFVSRWNLTCYTWRQWEIPIRDAVHDITSLRKAGVLGKPKIRINTPWRYARLFNFYRVRNVLPWIQFLERREDLQAGYDCYFYPRWWEPARAFRTEHGLKMTRFYQPGEYILDLPPEYQDAYLRAKAEGKLPEFLP